MRRDYGYKGTFTGSRAAGPGGGAPCQAAGGEHSPSGAGDGERPGLGGLWLLVAPLACCGGLLLIAALAAAGALAWAGLAALVLIRRRRRSRAYCEPGGGAASRDPGQRRRIAAYWQADPSSLAHLRRRAWTSST